MDDTQFWKIIKRAKSEADGDPEAIAEGVHQQLTELPASEIESFDAILRSKVAAAYAWKLWGAAYLMNGGCSDDGFEYFRGWLVAQGQKVYEAAVADPDSLAKVADPENDQHECEDILYVAMRAYEGVAGKQLPVPAGTSQAPEPSGERWDFDDQEATARQLPRLARKYDQ
ncbi:MAG TPA: DUF4240 domain-containing protein [Tepidisphaeraceae bacterium]|nr:DUF4240 domain-containing protein [Tepidisphaeraceae bacterium]